MDKPTIVDLIIHRDRGQTVIKGEQAIFPQTANCTQIYETMNGYYPVENDIFGKMDPCINELDVQNA